MKYRLRSSHSSYYLSTVLIFSFVQQSFAESAIKPMTIETIVVTTERLNRDILDTPYSVYNISDDDIRSRNYRTTPDIFRDVPGAMAQKTAHGQGSPFLRGFTGFQNLFLVDGIRLNNSVFRSGPNQYWNTVDPLSLNKLEVVMGPSSVLFGSDGIGGTVNAITKDPSLGVTNESPTLTLLLQAADAANMNLQRLEYNDAWDNTGIIIGANRKDYGNITSGNDYMPNTGYSETNLDIKLISMLQGDWKLSIAHYMTLQQDVPRTHKTIYSVPFNGTTVGDELKRDLDQRRQLTYIKLENHKLDTLSHLNASLSYHQQDESRDRLRTKGRTDQLGISVNTLGFTFDTGIKFRALEWLFGVDIYRDSVDSFSTGNVIQGPVADNASYITNAVFSELRWALQPNLNIILGARYSAAKAKSDRVSEPISGTSISLDRSWNDLVGNIRVNYKYNDSTTFFAGISEGFRAPNLSDLTRLDSARSNEFEIPSPDLDSESYVSYELGYRNRVGMLNLDFALYYTDIRHQVILFPTGNVTKDGEVEMTKSNQGDGFVYGSEILLSLNITQELSARLGLSSQYGKVTGFPEGSDILVEDYISRLQPFTGQASIKYSASTWWIESQFISMAQADKLSVNDQADTQRIPPNGTPGFGVFNVRGGYAYSENIYFNWSAENLLNKNYRVHGSGQNEVGRNFLVGLSLSF